MDKKYFCKENPWKTLKTVMIVAISSYFAKGVVT